ncbi:PREDICTED: uncharacterized protein LOC109207002 [Nicotiana attenuata]|uniref:uncharacterized protein LOC109207002 n=1 Tax=Nicotiana attenuata TaxID=49451 RepID=UPI000905C830|nr:PREDICTED: uncharacterized protein LOC109207002 [Nicotiana attenuata]
MVAKGMIGHGFKPRKGLGKSLQGIAEPITLTSSEKFFGVGFRPTPADVIWADDRKNDGWVLPQPVPHLYKTFVKPKYNEEEEDEVFTAEEIEEIYEEVNSVEAISEDTTAWKMFFDGAVNANGVGIGAGLISPTGQHYPATARLRFFSTNNTAEFEACIMGINMAIDQDVEELLIMGDSNLIIPQAQGEWESRDIKIIPYRQHVEDLSR